MKRTSVFVLGYPKTGTTWLCRMLGDILDAPIMGIQPPKRARVVSAEGKDRQGPYLIHHGHAIFGDGDELFNGHGRLVYDKVQDEKFIITFRDPRDVCVSASYHWEKTVMEIIHCTGNGLHPLVHGGGLASWYRCWLDFLDSADDNRFMHTRYESMSLDELGRIVKGLTNQDWDKSILEQVWQRQSMEARRKHALKYGDTMPYGKRFQLKFLRKGIVGDWKNHFASEHRRHAQLYFGDIMDRMGYTTDDAWIYQDTIPPGAKPEKKTKAPPDLDLLNWDSIKHNLRQYLIANKLLTWQDVQESQDGVTRALKATVRPKLLNLYKEHYDK